MKKILITGGAGFIGSHTADALLKKGYAVRVLDNLEPPVHPHGKKPDYVSGEIDFAIGDVRDAVAMKKALQGVEAVYHLAAYQGYLTDFSKFATVNDGGTALLYEIIVNERLPVRKVVLAGSQAVYGEGKYECPAHGVQYPLPRLREQLMQGKWEIGCPMCRQPMKPLPTDESRVNPHSQYAASKYAQELYGLALGRRFGVPTVAMRYSITQGTRQSFSNAYSGILRIFTVRLLNNQPVTMFEDGNQLRDYVHVEDVVAANLLVLEKDEADFQAFNVGASTACTVREFAQTIIRIMGRDDPVSSTGQAVPQCPGEFRFGDVRHIVSDISKLRGLGWEPRHTIERNIRDYLDWVKTQPAVSGFHSDADQVMRRQGIIQMAHTR